MFGKYILVFVTCFFACFVSMANGQSTASEYSEKPAQKFCVLSSDVGDINEYLLKNNIHESRIFVNQKVIDAVDIEKIYNKPITHIYVVVDDFAKCNGIPAFLLNINKK